MLKNFFVFLFFRISGNTALDKNIHASVSAQIKNFQAKTKWKVSVPFKIYYGFHASV